MTVDFYRRHPPARLAADALIRAVRVTAELLRDKTRRGRRNAHHPLGEAARGKIRQPGESQRSFRCHFVFMSARAG
jgi:hypothetical protein